MNESSMEKEENWPKEENHHKKTEFVFKKNAKLINSVTLWEMQ